MTKRPLTLLTLIAFTLPAFAQAWTTYGNARFGYFVDIPPGFSKIAEADNGDGGRAQAAEGKAELAVWGSRLTERKFGPEMAWRADQDRADGWTVSYQKEQPQWAVWSGAKGDRIFYARAIKACGGAAAFFRLEYEKTTAKAYDPIVARLSKSLRSGKC